MVIMPLIELKENLARRCRGLKIEYREYKSRNQPDGAGIVLMTPEAALGEAFQTFLNRIKGSQKLNRIVVDECHVVLNDQKDFRPKLKELRQLNRAGVQIIFLTATLPVGMKNRFMKRI